MNMILIFLTTVTSYNLVIELEPLMQYYERFWMDTVTPQRIRVFGLAHRTNNFIVLSCVPPPINGPTPKPLSVLW
jgi:hypothetical protein